MNDRMVATHTSSDLDSILDVLPDLVIVLDATGVVRYVNATAERTLGWKIADWIGRSVIDVVHPQDIDGAVSSLASVVGKAVGTPVEMRIRDSAGDWRWVEVIGADRIGHDGVDGIVCVARDITQRRMWEIAGDDVARFQPVVQHAPAITLTLDANGVITSVNGAFARLLGHDPSLTVGHHLTSFAAVDCRGDLQSVIEQVCADDSTASIESSMMQAPPRIGERPIRFEMVGLLRDPLVSGIIVSGYDITELKIARRDLDYLASHDALTGLANRTLLLSELGRLLEGNEPMAVVFIDLDRFKPVNDLFGHEVGDQLLREVGHRLERIVRPGDIVARVGGDEFVVVAPGIGSRWGAVPLADRIESTLAVPYALEAGPVRIGASLGVALSDPTSTVTSLLADADIRMYDAKSDRRGTSARPMAERRRSAAERRHLADELSVGLGRGEVVPYLQPIVDLRTGALHGMEALARWNHPQQGLLAPGAFMDLVDDAGLDLVLGDVILDAACAAVGRLALLGIRPQLAINLSVGQLTDPGLCDRVVAAFARNDLDLAQLVIEVTEKATLSRHGAVGAASADETLRALHDAGGALSLDDFGTGYSSLTHVRRFPLAEVKVDQSFIAGVLDHAEDRAVIEVIVGLATALGLLVVAEGVETPAQFAAVRELGCHRAQGYLIAHPMPVDDAVRWAIERAGRPDSD